MGIVNQNSSNPNALAGFTPIALYDTGIEDLKERMLKRLEFPTLTHAARFLKISQHALRRRLDPKAKLRATGPDGKEYAIRLLNDKIIKQ